MDIISPKIKFQEQMIFIELVTIKFRQKLVHNRKIRKNSEWVQKSLKNFGKASFIITEMYLQRNLKNKKD